ncbi:MAG: rRNA maturation RNase YbeY [Dorea sp.]|nr:rRNA maturation RNase YbeY [Dorea sp.]
MTLNVEEEGEIKLPLSCGEIAEKVALAALDHLGCPYEAEINLLLTTDEEIRQMNRKFRDMDRATDVLSFPMTDFEVPGEFGFLEERGGCFHPETGELLLGDIVISKERVCAQAEEYGHGLLREFAFLITHSVLHLTGYDHIKEEERLLMERLQREILDKLKIQRE